MYSYHQERKGENADGQKIAQSICKINMIKNIVLLSFFVYAAASKEWRVWEMTRTHIIPVNEYEDAFEAIEKRMKKNN